MKVPVDQGNLIDQDAVERLEVGMTKEQVRFLLGSPVLREPFDPDRWNYVYLPRSDDRKTGQRTLILFFEGDTLRRIEGDRRSPFKTADGAEATD